VLATNWAIHSARNHLRRRGDQADGARAGEGRAAGASRRTPPTSTMSALYPVAPSPRGAAPVGHGQISGWTHGQRRDTVAARTTRGTLPAHSAPTRRTHAGARTALYPGTSNAAEITSRRRPLSSANSPGASATGRAGGG